jgi:hypothetical protein
MVSCGVDVRVFRHVSTHCTLYGLGPRVLGSAVISNGGVEVGVEHREKCGEGGDEVRPGDKPDGME